MVNTFINSPDAKGGQPFIVIVLRDKDSKRYNLMKTELDLTVKVSNQCVVKKNADKANASCLANIVSAINAKASDRTSPGINGVVNNLPLMDQPCTMIGIDVHHPPPASPRPSEAAVSASINVSATRYYSVARSQKSRQESITEIRSMFEEILNESIKLKIPPYQRIVVIRDGVADTQFWSICEGEVQELKNAIAGNQAYAGKKPLILYIVAQKRNICRLGADKDGNIITPPAGTVLDNTITGRKTDNFYMVPHKAIIGSAKPIHFHVFQNDMKLSLNQIEDLLFKLCHLHPGCTRSVSLPLPLYNAHKLGYRMGQVFRAAMETDETRSESSSESGTSSDYVRIELPESLKYTPFFL